MGFSTPMAGKKCHSLTVCLDKVLCRSLLIFRNRLTKYKLRCNKRDDNVSSCQSFKCSECLVSFLKWFSAFNMQLLQPEGFPRINVRQGLSGPGHRQCRHRSFTSFWVITKVIKSMGHSRVCPRWPAAFAISPDSRPRSRGHNRAGDRPS